MATSLTAKQLWKVCLASECSTGPAGVWGEADLPNPGKEKGKGVQRSVLSSASRSVSGTKGKVAPGERSACSSYKTSRDVVHLHPSASSRSFQSTVEAPRMDGHVP